MNQILITKMSKIFKKRIYIFQFCIAIFLVSSLIIYLIEKKYSQIHHQEIAKIASKNYTLFHLYENFPNNHIVLENQSLSIIGNIEIPKLNISYPILSECSDEFLKISVCKFYGPDLNSIGNLCITGHNYDNGIFFSNLYLLDTGDIINIYDLNSKKLIYKVYDIYEIIPVDLSCLSQDTNRRERNYSNYL